MILLSLHSRSLTQTKQNYLSFCLFFDSKHQIYSVLLFYSSNQKDYLAQQKVGQERQFSDQKFTIEQKNIIHNALIVFKMQAQFETQCLVCQPHTVNVKKTSLVIMKLLRVVQIEKRKQKKLISLPSELYFKQLVDYFKLDLIKNKFTDYECSHKTLKNYVTKKLDISLDELFCLSEHIYNELSKRKFQLELIEKIAKNIHERAILASTNQKRSETSIKSPNKLQQKTSFDAQVPTVHTLQGEKVQQKQFIEQNQQFSKIIDHRQMQSSTEFQDQMGFCLSNYGMTHNMMYPTFYGPELGTQRFVYLTENIRKLITSGYFVGQMRSMNG